MDSRAEEESRLLENEQETDSEAEIFACNSFCDQLVILGRLSWPIIVSNLLQFSISSISIFSLGHISTTALAAFSLSLLLANVTGLCVSQGFGSALDTLLCQSYTGSNDYHLTGKHLQRGIVLSFIVSIPISTLWYFSEPFFLMLGQEKDIAQISAMFLQWMIPGLFPLFAAECLKRFLICQSLTKPSMYIMIFVALQSLFLQWLLLWSPWKVGVIGAPISISIVNITILILHILYLAFSQAGERIGNWEFGEMFDFKALSYLLCLFAPASMMIVSEWIALEAIALAAGMLGKTSLAAQTIAINTDSLLFMIPMGISVATSARIGHFLGANKPRYAKRVAIFGLFFSCIPALFNAIMLVIFRVYWGLMFTREPDVVNLVAKILPYTAFNQVADTFVCQGGAALRGAGLQSYGAWVNTLGYSVIGVPTALLFAFKFKMGLEGLWVGVIVAVTFVAAVQILILFRIDWEKEAHKAGIRVSLFESEISQDLTFPGSVE